MRKLVYLASPHSDSDPLIREVRYHRAMRALSHFMYTQNEYQIFSPIVHSHEMAKSYSMPKEFNFWRDIDFDWIQRSDEVWVLMLDGWDKSIGVTYEVELARKLGKPVRYWFFNCCGAILEDVPGPGVVYPTVPLQT